MSQVKEAGVAGAVGVAEGAAAPSDTPQSLSMVAALNAGLRQAMREDPATVLFGEDVGPLGGVFRVTDGLQAEFGVDRVWDSPLAESAIIGSAIGLAMSGMRPIVEIQFDGFVFPGFNQLTTQLAKLHYRSGGALNLPVTIRIPYGGHIGGIEHHSESPEAYFLHTPGLRVMTPATPGDAYQMIRQAIACPDPVVFLEPKSRYWQRGPVELAGAAGSAGSGEAGSAVVQHIGARIIRRTPAQSRHAVTVVAYGPSVAPALTAAQIAAQEGIELEVIDLRSLSPLDTPAIVESVARTGRLVAVSEAPGFVSLASEICALVAERCFGELRAAPRRVTGYFTPYPASAHESEYLPGPDLILDAVDSVIYGPSPR